MTEPDNKVGLLRMTDEQLREAYQRSIKSVCFSTNDYYREIERRTQERHSRAIRLLTWITVILMFIATFATVLGLWPKF